MSENKPYTELVRHITDIYPNLKEDKEKFSDFVIARFVGNFMKDPQVSGEHEEKKSKAKELYTSFVNAWEELYGDRDQQN